MLTTNPPEQPMSQPSPNPWSGYATLLSIVAVLLSAFWKVAIEPLQKDIADLQEEQRRQQTTVHQLRVDNQGLVVHMETQSEALRQLAAAVDKLADKLNR